MSEPAMQTSACVDCGITILGERLRCPRCHAEHAETIGYSDLDDTVPIDAEVRASQRIADSPTRALVAWFVSIQIVAIVVLGFALAARGCR